MSAVASAPTLREAEDTGVVVAGSSYGHPQVLREQFAARHGHAGQLTVLEQICEDLETNVFTVLVRATSVSDFQDRRSKLFDRYVQLSGAVRMFAPVRDTDEQVFARVLEEIEADTSLPWTNPMQEEAHFCASTLFRAYMLASEILRSPLRDDGDSAKKDREFASQFALACLWAQLHLDCIVFAMHNRPKPKQQILGALVDSMRTSVLAYANARLGYDLRCASPDDSEPPHDEQGWSPEEKSLVEGYTRLSMEAVSKYA